MGTKPAFYEEKTGKTTGGTGFLMPHCGYLYPRKCKHAHRLWWEIALFTWTRQKDCMEKKRLGPEAALQKLKHYCAYQDRCHKEVKEKLAGYGLFGQDADALISTLIEEDYLNEERFACSYARGHFRMRQWGRVRIRYELKQKGISTYCIGKALGEIQEDDYLDTLHSLIKKKAETCQKDEKAYIKRHKIAAYIIQKGFEAQMVHQEIVVVLKEGSE